MKKVVQANINWVPQEEGGRKVILPAGMRYCPIIVFESAKDADMLWSAEIYNKHIDGRSTISEVAFLAEDAPHQLLQTGSRFSLFEGQNLVAEGTVAQ